MIISEMLLLNLLKACTNYSFKTLSQKKYYSDHSENGEEGMKIREAVQQLQ